nr:MAG TPA: replisome organizer [Caudoviricetes sp.]
MAEEKRYFWLRLYDDFFTSKRIKKLRKIAGGDTYVIIYLKMQLVAMKHDGTLKWSGLEENIADELALELDEDPANVEVTLQYLISCGLAEASNDLTEVFLPFSVKNVGSEGATAQRMREYRARKNSALPEHDCNDVTTPCEIGYGESEIEIESESEIEDPPYIPPRGDKEKKSRPVMEPQPEERFTGDLLDAVNEWLDYKWERNRKEFYKPRGYQNLISQLGNKAKTMGDGAVAQQIRYSMANNYQGILFDKLDKGKKAAEVVYPPESKAYRAARYFAEQKEKDNPGRAQPTEDDLQRWADAMERLHQENKVDWKTMAEVMDYSLDSEWWSRKVQSAFDFKKHFNSIFADMVRDQGAVKE